MDTWEVVVILLLTSISIIALVSNKLPLAVLDLLDNTLFQLALLGLALGAAVVSPPVAIVGIATIVVVYYVRNLIKMNMVASVHTLRVAPPEELNHDLHKGHNHDEPRIEVKETEVKETTKTTVTQVSVPVSTTNLPNVIGSSPTDNIDVMIASLRESDQRIPLEKLQEVKGDDFKTRKEIPIKSVEPPKHENFPNPRGGSSNVESFDTDMDIYGSAPEAGTPIFTHDQVDSDIFSPAPASPDAFNELRTAAPYNRPYSDKAGQYGIEERRPTNGVGKYEIADFMPGNDVGSNDFKVMGPNIDEKIANLKRGIPVSSDPPPGFDNVVPPRAANYVQ